MACEDCLNRRDFLTRGALVAAALIAVDACGDGQIGAPIRNVPAGDNPDAPISAGVVVKLTDFPELATVGTIVAIGSERALVRLDATSFHGLSTICTHQQCDTDVRNNQFQCPCHGSVFAADGSVIKGPDISSPPITPLLTLTTTFDPVAGTVSVA
jgi:cytochrome b6-f complex iron-sulfur subunit